MLGFLEKPDPEQIDTDEINAGAYVIERRALDLIPPGRAVSIEREVFPRLVGDGLFGCRLDGYWMDIGTPERYLQASWDILEGTVETELAGDGGPFVAHGAELAADARIAPRAVLRSGSSVGSGALIDDLRTTRRLPGRRPRRGARVDPRRRGRRRRRGDDRTGRCDRARSADRGRRRAAGGSPGRAGRGRRGAGAGEVSDTLAAIRAVDPSGQLDDVLALPEHLRDALWRVESAGLEAVETRAA